MRAIKATCEVSWADEIYKHIYSSGYNYSADYNYLTKLQNRKIYLEWI